MCSVVWCGYVYVFPLSAFRHNCTCRCNYNEQICNLRKSGKGAVGTMRLSEKEVARTLSLLMV